MPLLLQSKQCALRLPCGPIPTRIPLFPGRFLRLSIWGTLQQGRAALAQLVGTAHRRDGSVVPWRCAKRCAVQLRANQKQCLSVTFGGTARDGVDFVWQSEAVYAQIGVEVQGHGSFYIDGFEVTDVTAAVLADEEGAVAVTEFGAVGDGAADCTIAFEAANAAAQGGRTLVVPPGKYRLTRSVTIDAPICFRGQVVMPELAVLILRQNLDLTTYCSAFGIQERGFKKTMQALLAGPNGAVLDLCNQRICLSVPIDAQALVPRRTFVKGARSMCNGVFVRADPDEDKPLLDFSGFTTVQDFELQDVTLDGVAKAQAIIWPQG